MAHFTANRLSSGNRVFPDEVTVDESGITLKIPSLLRGKAKTLTFHQINSVEVDNPLVGFSTVTFKTTNFDRIVASGFSKSDAAEIKRLAHIGIQGALSNSGGGFGAVTGAHAASQAQAEAEMARVQLETRQQQLEEQRNRQQRADELRAQGRNRQAFFTEYQPIITTIAAIAGIGILYLIFFSSSGDNDFPRTTASHNQPQTTLEAQKIEATNRPKQQDTRPEDQTSGLVHYGEMDAAGGEYPQASFVSLQADDLSNLSKQQLKLMRNEIFARHGYIFKDETLNQYFKQQSWYNPQFTDISDLLTPLEKENIMLIKRYE